MNAERLIQLARAWRRHVLLRDGVTSLLLAEAAFMGGGRVWALAVFAGVFALLLLRARPWDFHAAGLAAHLNRAFPTLEESSQLWLRAAGDLGAVEKLQRRRIDAAIAELDLSPVQPRSRQLLPLILAVLAAPLFLAVFHFAVPHLGPTTATPIETTPRASPPSIDAPAVPVSLSHVELTITPPAYTQRPVRSVTTLDAEVESGSTLRWQIAFAGAPAEAQLVFDGRENVRLTAFGEGRFEGARLVSEFSLYSVRTAAPAWNPPDLHPIRVLLDRPPGIAISNPARARTELPAPEIVAVDVTVSDDYGVTAAWLVATVAKGTGESVKFREQKIAFERDEVSGGTRSFHRVLDLAALGLAAGDELYFHVEALDNRVPKPNLARSETRFLVVRGPQGSVSSSGRGVFGVNLVPEYFRSQRQLIIDTEKLLVEQPRLAEVVFRARANELGIDQQLLRQRYGQFLGEEAEGDIAPRAGAEKKTAEGIPESMIHRHDTGSDHNHAQALKPAADTPGKNEKDAIAPYLHQHDSQDAATFFDAQTKGTLRDVLSAMWESERYLRTARPKESLPAQIRALAVLKQLQEADRAYVQRVGFEPAPIKIEERRLVGDVGAVPRAGQVTPPQVPSDAAQRAIREALRVVDWNRANTAFSEAERVALQGVEPVLGRAAAGGSEAALAGLQTLRRARDATLRGDLLPLEQALRKSLASTRPAPQQTIESAPELADAYFEELRRRQP